MTTPDSTEALHAALAALARAYQFRDRHRIACHGISVTQCYALESVVRAGPMTLNDLAAALFLEKSTVSRLVDNLEAQRLLLRQPHPESGRSVWIRATAAGRALHRRIETELIASEAKLLDSYPSNVRVAVTEVLWGLADLVVKRSAQAEECVA